MRVAIFHDYLNQLGGAERVLQNILEIFPDADIYTLIYSKERTQGLFDKNVKGVSFLNKKFVAKHHRIFLWLMFLASDFMKIKDNYDLIISSTAGYAKGFNYRNTKSPFHICYCHSPLRYAWDIEYIKNLPRVPFLLNTVLAMPMLNFLKKWDFKAAQKPNIFIANSEFIRKKINSYYQRDAIVIHPGVDLNKFYFINKPRKNYFLMVGRLLYYKNFDLGIEAFNQLKLPLKIVGTGPEFKKIQKLVRSPYIEFLHNVSDDELRNLYNEAEALIFPQIEDFGLVAAEAQACGLPVIAYNKGGAKEIIINNKTGLLFNIQNIENLSRAVIDFKNMKFDHKYIAQVSKRFSKEIFKNKFITVLKNNGFMLDT
ncbi:MAG: glycosyltransferase [Minisyncoccia bacterium]